jgi:signal transduction histidine kinase
MKHFATLVGLAALLIVIIVYPFLPGSYDRLAMGLSTMAQVFGVVGLPLVIIGSLWLVFEGWRLRRQNPTATDYRFAVLALVVSSLVVLVVALVAYATTGIVLGLMALGLWLFLLTRLVPRAQGLKQTGNQSLDPTPLYMVILPLVAFIAQSVLAAPLTESSRSQAMTMSAAMIRDIETYHAVNGEYPDSVLAVWQDYAPSVIGIDRYHYAPQGESYNLAFEQPRFLFDNLGTREFVVYNPRDEHAMISHDSWIILLPPEELATSQGWFEVNDAGQPHWKYFWFD